MAKRRSRTKKKEEITYKIEFKCPEQYGQKIFPIFEKALNLLPIEVKEYILEHPIRFSAEFKEFRGNALLIEKKEFEDVEYLLHFHHHVWDYDKSEIIRIILHEIAHIYLGHSSVEVMTMEGYDEEEMEADDLVVKWVSQTNT